MIEVSHINDLLKIPNANNGDLGQAIVRLNTTVKAVKQAGIKRNILVSIRNRSNGKVIYAIARSNNAINRDTIALEYDQRHALGYDPKGTATFEIRRVNAWAYIEYFRKHPNPHTRLTFVMGFFTNLLFCVLGVGLGLALSALSNSL